MMDVFPLPKEQINYTYSNSQQISMQTGLIGHLRADFGSEGSAFYSTWFDFRRELKSEEFKQDLDDVINALRDNPAYGNMLKSRSAMSSYGWQHPETTMQGNYCPEHFVRVNTDHHAFLLRMNPTKGDYNLYCYRKREEHGSASWGRASQVNHKYAAKPKTENKILTQNVAIGLNGHKHRRNLNVLICGGSGAGKTRFYHRGNGCHDRKFLLWPVCWLG